MVIKKGARSMKPLPFHKWQELKLKEFAENPNKKFKQRRNWWAKSYGGYCLQARKAQEG